MELQLIKKEITGIGKKKSERDTQLCAYLKNEVSSCSLAELMLSVLVSQWCLLLSSCANCAN